MFYWGDYPINLLFLLAYKFYKLSDTLIGCPFILHLGLSCSISPQFFVVQLPLAVLWTQLPITMIAPTLFLKFQFCHLVTIILEPIIPIAIRKLDYVKSSPMPPSAYKRHSSLTYSEVLQPGKPHQSIFSLVWQVEFPPGYSSVSWGFPALHGVPSPACSPLSTNLLLYSLSQQFYIANLFSESHHFFKLPRSVSMLALFSKVCDRVISLR